MPATATPIKDMIIMNTKIIIQQFLLQKAIHLLKIIITNKQNISHDIKKLYQKAIMTCGCSRKGWLLQQLSIKGRLLPLRL